MIYLNTYYKADEKAYIKFMQKIADKVSDLDKIKASKDDLPDTTVFKMIDGSNHSGFGSYGHQKGDGEAVIDSNMQQAIAAEATVNMLKSIK